jgi:DNA-nicking Smr family endonuclease
MAREAWRPMMLTLDLHPLFRSDRDIDRAVRQIVFRAAATDVELVEIIPGKGRGKLRSRVLALLGQPQLKRLYTRYEVDPSNQGRILIHFK